MPQQLGERLSSPMQIDEGNTPMAWWDVVQSGVLALVVPALIMIGVRLQKQDETIRRVLELEQRDDNLTEKVTTNSKDIAVLQSQYATIESLLRRIDIKLDDR